MHKTFSLSPDKLDSLKNILLNLKYVDVNKGKNKYVLFSYKNPLGKDICTAYNTGKVVIANPSDKMMMHLLEKELNCCLIKQQKEEELNFENKTNQLNCIGLDESGKGDSFGPVCFAAVYIDDKSYEKVISFANDSKKLSDKKIKEFSKIIKNHCVYEVETCTPLTYNRLTKEGLNASEILLKYHLFLVDKIKEKINENTKVVIDKFPLKANLMDSNNSIIFSEQGESKYISVACASIIARNCFCDYLENMKSKWNFEFPKGSTNANSSIEEFCKKYNRVDLEQVAKLHFKNVKNIASNTCN